MKYVSFNHKEANFHLSSPGEDLLISSIIRNRKALDKYIGRNPDFIKALSPLQNNKSSEKVPEIARRMYEASVLTGLGPMASVAGGFAQTAVESALTHYTEKNIPAPSKIVVENGGDICLWSREEIILGIFPGSGALKTKLAFRIRPTGESGRSNLLAVCSSSSTMGHSFSFGNCDLAVVTGPDGFIVDSAATLACNLIKRESDIQQTLNRLTALQGVSGVLIIYKDKIGVAGDLPELIKNADPEIQNKITKDLHNRR